MIVNGPKPRMGRPWSGKLFESGAALQPKESFSFTKTLFCQKNKSRHTTTSLWEEMTLIFENLHNTPVAQQENRSRKSLKKIIFTPSSELTGETILFTYEKLKLPWNQGWFENVQKLSFCVFKMCQNPPFISTNAGAFHITCTVIYYEINEKKLTCVSGTILSTVPPSDKDKWFPVSMNVWETLWW